MRAITNGKIYTITNGIFDPGTVLMDGGRIVAVGEKVDLPPGTEVVDVKGAWVFPGFIDAHTHLAVGGEGFGMGHADYNEAFDPVTPHLRAIDAVFPEDVGLRDAVSVGITTAGVTPGSANVIGGQGVVIKTQGRTVAEMTLGPWGMKAALGENPKMVYGEQKKMPSTRLGIAAVLRDQLVKAQNYLEKVKKAAGNPDKLPERDLKLEALAEVIKGELPLRVHAHRADDIMTALRVGEEFGLRVIIEHCTEGHKVAKELARRGVSCTVGPTFGARSKVELRDKSWRTPAALAEAGVRFAIISDHPFSNVRFLPLFAGLAVREGLPEEAALRAITIDAAALVGQEARLGSIEAGKDADLVVLSGHPFSLKTQTLYTFINGELVYSRN